MVKRPSPISSVAVNVLHQPSTTDYLGTHSPNGSHHPLRAPEVESEIPDNNWKCSDCRHQVNLLDPTHDTLVQQHRDYHLALELSRPVDNNHERDPSLAFAPKRIKRPATYDIRRFFGPQ